MLQHSILLVGQKARLPGRRNTSSGTDVRNPIEAALEKQKGKAFLKQSFPRQDFTIRAL